MALTDLEEEILACCAMAGDGETTRTLQVEMLQAVPDRPTLEEVLRGLVRRGLLWEPGRAVYGGVERDRLTGVARNVEYEDDWWATTDAGRALIGLDPRSAR